MNRLEHRRIASLRVEIRPSCEPHPARNRRTKIGENIAEEIARHHDAEPLRIFDEEHACRIDKQAVCLNIGILLPDLSKDFIPEHHRVSQCIPLGNRGKRALLTSRQLVGVTDDALTSVP